MQAKTLLYIANARLPTERAHGVQIMKMCEALAALGLKVVLAVPDRRTSIVGDSFAYYGVKENFSIVKLPVIELPLSIPGAFLLETLSFARVAMRYLKKNPPPDIVYTRGEMALFLPRAMAPQTKFIFETHSKPNTPNRYRTAAARAALIVAVTKHYAAEIPHMLSIEEKKVLWVPDGVSLEPFAKVPEREASRQTLGLPRDKKIILYAGSDLPWKGLGALRAAAALLPPECLAVFVGDSKGEDSDKTFFAGVRPHAEIPQWLAAADVLALTGDPHSEVARFYTSPLKLFEYMAVGRPIVATDLPAVRDILSQDNAYLAEPTSQGLARAIQDALAHPEEAAAKAHRARQDVERYTWEARARAILTALV